MKTKLKSQKGFTIIEVLIVLAIAGLILLIVFLAVPALQRNSRNTQAKNNAAALLAAATEFTNNNNGTAPASAANTASIVALTKNKNITALNYQANANPVTPTLSTATLVVGYKCPTTVSGASVTPVAASSRAMALVYAIEDSTGAAVAQCSET